MAETAEETAALSKAKLEQKDRAELAAIVEAMGGKATSRAKKADLVELVLQLAGAPTPQPAESRPAPRKEAPVEEAAEPAAAWEQEDRDQHDEGMSAAASASPAAHTDSSGSGQDRPGGGPQGQPGAQSHLGPDGEPANRRRRRR